MQPAQLLEHLSDGQIPDEEDLVPIFLRATEILQKEPNIRQLSTPVTICGDIHGQFADLLELFRVGGDCFDTNYLFLGDYVDRGAQGVESFLYLLGLFLRYPARVTLLRGNHEARQTTQSCGFYEECIRKFGGTSVWHLCTDLFDLFPIAAIVDNTIFCVHGGLSPEIHSVDQIAAIDRRREPPVSGAFVDILWSDPDEQPGFAVSPRGAGFLFGGDIVAAFNRENNMSLICRAHQLMMEGYGTMFDDQLVTVWSAPNYCYRTGNVASILEIDENLTRSFRIFEASPDAQGGAVAGITGMPPYFS
jgi:serine/threonine-protein phosphatase 4 catalytic subunit